MKKGIGPAIAVLGIALLIIVLAVAFIAGSIWGRHHTEKKYLFEAGLISESDKVETYVRSFLRATDLSSLQSIYDSGRGAIILPYDSGWKYSPAYKLPYWKIYDDDLSTFIPPPSIMVNKFKQRISWISSNYLQNYQSAYRDFAENSGFEIDIPDPTSNPIIVRVTDFSEDGIKTEGDLLSFHLNAEVEDQEIDIVRIFNPYSEIDVKLERIIEIAIDDVVEPDILDNCIITEANDVDAQGCLNIEASGLEAAPENSGIGFIFEIKDNDFTDPGHWAIIRVLIYDISRDYTFYSFSSDSVELGSLGVNFLVKVGNEDDGGVEESVFTGISNTCGSELGIIEGELGIDECNYFTVAPTNPCEDPDGGKDYETSSICNDFTGSYEDTCVDNTLYEYYCFDGYEICHYEKHDCDYGCDDGICKPESACCQNLLDIVNAAMGKQCGEVGYDKIADIDKNTIVNVMDILSVSVNCGVGTWCQDRLDDTSSPCMQSEELFVDGFDSTFTDWSNKPDDPPPWLGDNDDLIWAGNPGDMQGNFSFEDHTGIGAIVSVNLSLETGVWLTVAGKTYDVWLYNGTWHNIWTVRPVQLMTGTEYDWNTTDVTDYLDMWDKIDNAEIMFNLTGTEFNSRDIRRVKLVVEYGSA